MSTFDRWLSWFYTYRIFGSRCPGYCAECHCCIAWAEHDELFN